MVCSAASSDTKPEEIDFNRAVELLAERAAKGPSKKGRRKKAKKKAAKKKTTKKKTAKKKAKRSTKKKSTRKKAAKKKVAAAKKAAARKAAAAKKKALRRGDVITNIWGFGEDRRIHTASDITNLLSMCREGTFLKINSGDYNAVQQTYIGTHERFTIQ